MKQDNSNELLPLVDEAGNVIGSATRGECHSGSMLLHPVVHLHLVNESGNVYLQKRPEWKDIQPGKWDTAVGGHVDVGEKIPDALIREVREEIGLTDFTPAFIRSYVFSSSKERELINVFAAVSRQAPVPSDELDGGRFWSTSEIEDNIGNNVFTPNFESEYKKILRPYLQSIKEM